MLLIFLLLYLRCRNIKVCTFTFGPNDSANEKRLHPFDAPIVIGSSLACNKEGRLMILSIISLLSFFFMRRFGCIDSKNAFWRNCIMFFFYFQTNCSIQKCWCYYPEVISLWRWYYFPEVISQWQVTFKRNSLEWEVLSFVQKVVLCLGRNTFVS